MQEKIHKITGNLEPKQTWVSMDMYGNCERTIILEDGVKLTQQILAQGTKVTPNDLQTFQGIVETPYQETSDDCTGNLFKPKKHHDQ